MFDKVLIANRGEIAVRVMRTCRDMGISTVAIYSDADKDALHVRFADETVRIGPGPATASYLNIDAVVSAALSVGAQAIHPGYGFLSENANFAEACASAGIVFIGPSPHILRLLGDKSEAKKRAQQAGVPVVPGFYMEGLDPEAIEQKAGEIGYPVLIKAAFGGGGRGMRTVSEASELTEAMEGARREAMSSFGNDTVILEKHIVRPRHIEVQIIGDSHGNLLSLGERECSVQRRFQKVIEETPSVAVTPEIREGLESSALALASAVNYTNAGTVEFLLDADGNFYFLEVNPRLQVEHPVTEWVTGLDLVRLQLLAAAGERLPIDKSAFNPVDTPSRPGSTQKIPERATCPARAPCSASRRHLCPGYATTSVCTRVLRCPFSTTPFSPRSPYTEKTVARPYAACATPSTPMSSPVSRPTCRCFASSHRTLTSMWGP